MRKENLQKELLRNYKDLVLRITILNYLNVFEEIERKFLLKYIS